MSSTPMHVALYNAFQWQPPVFGHVPLLVERSGQKLSKRNTDIDISHFRDEQALLPETLVNFAALLGWSHMHRSDVFSLEELEQTVKYCHYYGFRKHEGSCFTLIFSTVRPQIDQGKRYSSFRKAMVSPEGSCSAICGFRGTRF